MIWLTAEQVKSLHRQVVAATGGSADLRDEGLLLSALASPLQTFGGEALYPTTLERAARLGYQLAQNHAFVDGNKRIGVHCMLVVLSLNGIRLRYTQDELANLYLSIAADATDYPALLEWVRARM